MHRLKPINKEVACRLREEFLCLFAGQGSQAFPAMAEMAAAAARGSASGSVSVEAREGFLGEDKAGLSKR